MNQHHNFIGPLNSFNETQQYIDLVEGVESTALFTRTQGAENQIPQEEQLSKSLILGSSFP
ncbi:5315_t:CDS:2 [Dentiscutata heterogama]|uniref:5315_t:CDS:1 n=1 Tax=Dentiscutata heterogama TaxID=1316150 RepID=A0ACA9KHQ7_9GLOM|nr:5315_t:CDS:2 [Dentiscutata heterogama]